MRFLGLFLVFAALPVIIGWLRSRPADIRYAAAAVGFLPFGIIYFNFDAALINWDMWPGHTKGMLVTILDSFALAILVASRTRIGFPPFLALLLLYIASAIASVLVSVVPMSSAFYVFQLVRVLVVFLAVVLLSQEVTTRRWLCFGLAGGAVFQAFFSVMQKFEGVIQATGTVGHQNLLGMMLHFATLPLIAMILAGDRNKLVLLGAASGLLAAALTGSRATIAFLGVAVGILVILSLARRATVTKWRALGLGVVGLLIIAPLTFSTFVDRFTNQEVSGDAERAAFERAASQMWADHPFGVGANQYVTTANMGGYSEAAGVIPVEGSRSAHVHNIYLLHGAEMGWLGILSFTLLVVAIIFRGIRFAFRERNDPRGELVLGASVAMLAMALHGYFEWIVVNYQPQYLIAIVSGIIAAAIYRAPAYAGAEQERPGIAVRRDAIVDEVMR